MFPPPPEVISAQTQRQLVSGVPRQRASLVRAGWMRCPCLQSPSVHRPTPAGHPAPALPLTRPAAAALAQIWRHQLASFYRNSPYLLKPEGGAAGGGKRKRGADFVESYKEEKEAAEAASGSGRGGGAGEAAACTVTMTLHPLYFPEELYTQQRRWGGGGVGGSAGTASTAATGSPAVPWTCCPLITCLRPA